LEGTNVSYKSALAFQVTSVIHVKRKCYGYKKRSAETGGVTVETDCPVKDF
jgi:uncharacterized protein YciW